ncbi:MAG: ATP-binding protein [Moraxellaceae bacterium]|nr:ATP-binding protein [Moraxellaceae bacterium]MDP1776910.1 ATP-binding protein [Moraxellaceae bacterium]
MIEPPCPANEAGRLQALRSLEVLDVPPEERFDRVTRLANKMFEVPIALVSLVDEDRQWFKSTVGLDATESPRSIYFCGHAILSDDVFVVEDALQDNRFFDNPAVTDEPFVRFYAGAPLRLTSGFVVGTLCIVAREPRHFTQQDRELLTELSELVVQELEDIHTAARERELRESIDRAGALIQKMDEKGRLTMVNQAWVEAVGLDAETAEGLEFAQLIAEPDQEKYADALALLLATGKNQALNLQVLKADQSFIHLQGMLSAIKTTRGMVCHGVFQDMTAQIELEHMRQEVAHHVSHELKTPLSATSMALDMLMHLAPNLDAMQAELLAVARRGAEHLQHMVNDLLDVGKVDSGKVSMEPVPTELGQLLRDSMQTLNPLVSSAGLTLQVSVPEQAIWANVDAVRIHQVLSNLVGNALKFTPAPGKISVTLALLADNNLEVRVNDTGMGIKADDLAHLFDRLYQTNNKAMRGEKGLGLGLHICRALVQAHGGSIGVCSDFGHGSTFWFTLPTTEPVH